MEGVEETREGEAEARVKSDAVSGGLADKVFDCLHEQVDASDRRHVEGQRHRRESHRE